MPTLEAPLKLTHGEFVRLMLAYGRRGANCVAIHAVVKVPVKKECQHREVFKSEVVSGQVQFCYKRNVTSQLRRESLPPTRFKPGTSWHTVVLANDGKLSPFSRHKERQQVAYLRFRKLAHFHREYFDIDGRDIPESEVEPFLVRNEKYPNQGVKSPIRFKIYKLSSVHSIKMDGREYILNQSFVKG